ncbi:LysR family transcriptional regulator [Eubacteriales bacterium OttesenSCG-928-N14]|nr:LysR family transcriptional regulator [Eubacteriales bacterium OttesenSCG-928-N14]
MNIDQMRYIISIAEMKSLSRAAQIHFISQSALTQHLKKLEKQLGTKLFVRKHNEWLPTEAGEIYLEMSRNIVAMYDEAQQKITELVFSYRHSISICMSAEVSNMFLSPIYARYMKQYPNTTVNLHEEYMFHAQRMLLADEIEMAYSIMPLPWQHEEQKYLESVFCIQEPLWLIAPSSHALSHHSVENPEEPVDIRLLKHETFICHQKPKVLRYVFDEIMREHEIMPKQQIEALSTRSVIDYVKNGGGMAFVPQTFLRKDELYRNRFQVRIIRTLQQPSWQVGVLYHKSRTLSPEAKSLCDMLEQSIRECLRESEPQF